MMKKLAIQLTPRRSLYMFLAFGLVLVQAPVVHAADDPIDSPAGPVGKTDIRKVNWDVGTATTALTVSLEASTYGAGIRAEIGLTVVIDTDGDGLGDAKVTALRNADGLKVDLAVWVLDNTLSTMSCQALSGPATSAAATVDSVLASGLESFAFSFDTSVIPGGLSSARWVAFGQSPPDTSVARPWDYLPDAANPDLDAPNPGDRRCLADHSGIRLSLAPSISVRTYPLTVSRIGTGAGSVTSSPVGISCGYDCAQAYEPGTLVTLTAHAATSSKFAGWSGACSGTGNCQVTMSQARSVSAAFKRRTTTTLSTVKTPQRLVSSGRVSPAHPGHRVTVTLLKKKSGSFVRLAVKRPLLSSASHYSAWFTRPSGRTCRIVARFADADHVGSVASRTFTC